MPTKIISEKCIGCKTCYDICPMDVITWDNETNTPQVTYGEVCWHCGICYMECPKRAIEYIYPPSAW
jgi:adenylylsulfate reductase subunit B